VGTPGGGVAPWWRGHAWWWGCVGWRGRAWRGRDCRLLRRAGPGDRPGLSASRIPRGRRLQPGLLRAEDLFTLPHPDPTGADGIFKPTGFVEPGPGADRLPIQTLLIPTDRTAAAQERIRTLAATTVPMLRSKTSDDLATAAPLNATGIAALLPYAMVFVLLFTACSLTVVVLGGIHERRRPFALLRASGVRLAELRRIVLLETGAPLTLAVLLGVGLATIESLVSTPPGEWTPPSAAFFIGLAGGVLAAFAVSLAALPFLHTATRLDTVRFE
jgi:FtsX-like permease family protein